MGVLTVLYSVPPAIMKKVRADNERLAFVFGDEETDDPAWRAASYDFDKHFYEFATIVSAAGAPTARRAFDFEDPADNEPEYGSYDLRVATPTKVKKIAKELAAVTFEQAKAKALEQETTDYSGRLIPADEYEGYAGDLEEVKAFFAKAAEAGHFIVGAEG